MILLGGVLVAVGIIAELSPVFDTASVSRKSIGLGAVLLGVLFIEMGVTM